MTPTPEEVEAGHAFYTKRALSVYDPMIRAVLDDQLTDPQVDVVGCVAMFSGTRR